MVVTSRAADVARVTVDGVEVEGTVEHMDGPPGPAVTDTGEVTPAGETLPEVDAEQDAPVDVDGDGQVTGDELFTKADLITECENRGLPTSGNKPDLVARLQEADKTAAPEGGD